MAVPLSNIGRQIVKGAGWVVAQRFATRAIGLISTLVLARLLIPTDFGLVALATTFATGVDTLGALGVQYALIVDPGIDRDKYDSAFTLTVIRGVLSGVAVAILAPFIARFVGDPRLYAVTLVIAGTMVVQGWENIGVVAFRKDFRFDKDTMLFLVPRVPSAIVTITSAILFHSYWALVAGIVVGRITRLITSYVMHPYRPRFTLVAWRPLLGFSFWIWLTGIAAFLKGESSAFVIARLLGTAPVGLFNVASEIATLTSSELVVPICRALFPGFSAAMGSGQDIRRLFVGAYSVTMLLVVPAAIGLSLVADPLVRVALGPNWSAAGEVLRIVAPSAIFSVLVLISGMAFLSMGRQDLRGKVGLVSAAICLLFLIVGVDFMGLVGAAWAILATQIVDAIMILVLVTRNLPNIFVPLLRSVQRTFLAAAIMAAVVLSANGGWPVSGADFARAAVSLSANVALGAAAFLAGLLAVWLATGRPEGPETDIYRFLRTLPVLRRR